MLVERPSGMPTAACWSVREEPVAEPGPGEILVRVGAISIDPAMRRWVHEGRYGVPAVEIGGVMRALAIGTVVESKHADFAEGNTVRGMLGVQDYACVGGSDVEKVSLSSHGLSAHLGVLGESGATAYFGMIDIGRPRSGETVVVSGAAGGVGCVAAVIAKIKGCRVFGIAGGPDKSRFLVEELGLDGAIDYKNDDVPSALDDCCPGGIDLFFDNVGGDVLDAVLPRLTPGQGARVVICGAISQYNNPDEVRGPSNYMSLVVCRARMEGFLVYDYRDRHAEADRELGRWLSTGELKSWETVIAGGVERFPEALIDLYSGANIGKLVVELVAAE